jgi:peptide deformylase
MAILQLLIYPDVRLKTISSPVTVFNEELRLFINDLEETMRAGPGSVGIAAPQVGRFERVIIVDVSTKLKIKHHGHLVLINPEITNWENFEIAREGCMSVPDYTGNVIRAKSIELLARNEHGLEQRYEMEGYEARAVQHEIDHLDGLLFLDRLVSRRHDLFQRQTYKKSNEPRS